MLRYRVVPRLNPIDKTTKYYAQLATVQPLNIDEIADIISGQCTVTPHDVKAVLSALEEQIYIAMRNGQSVRLGDLGSFHPTLGSIGSESAVLFKNSNVNNARVRFTISSRMRHELSLTNPKVKLVNLTENTVESPGPQH